MISKIVILFYVGAFVLFVIGALLTRKPRASRGKGGATFLARKRRKLIGITLIVVSLLSVATGVLTQMYSIGPFQIPPEQAKNGGGPTAQNPSTPSTTLTTRFDLPPSPEAAAKLQDAFKLVQNGQSDAGLSAADAIIKTYPQYIEAYALRGDIYSTKKEWTQAILNFQAILTIDSKNSQAKFNLAEVNFREAKYDIARIDFAALEQDPDLGDLCSFKVFLCDLFGGREDIAQKELDAFNQVGENASYYFANVSWALYHKNTEEARNWLTQAIHVYPPYKVRLYSSSLKILGYLPLPPPA